MHTTMPSHDNGDIIKRPDSAEDASYEIDTEYVEVPTDFSAIVRQEFGFRSKPRDKYITSASALSDDERTALAAAKLVERAEDNDYAPKRGTRRKRNTKSKKKKVELVEPESDDEHSVNPDMQAYFDKTSARQDEDGNDIFCICRRGDLGKWMIGCDGCDEWYHGECIDVSKADEGLIDQYFCPRCQRDGEGTTIWKRKCRLNGCRKPALDTALDQEDIVMAGTDNKQTRTKYCSRDHGLEYFRQQVAQALLTKPQIKSLILSVTNATDFKKIGDVAPTVEGKVTAVDIARLDNMSRERQEIYDELARLEKRVAVLVQMRDRAARVNASIKARKEKEICGLDERLDVQDSEFDTMVAAQDLVQSLARSTETDRMCTVPIKKCTRHAGWYAIKSDGYHLDETLLKERLAKLREEDQEVRLIARRRVAD